MSLFIVPTPIGNLGDISFRAIDTLKAVDLILAEDTRTSSVLLQHYQVQKPVSPYHQHNEHKIVAHLAAQLSSGKTMALLTDAGTPGISDPAFFAREGMCEKWDQGRMPAWCHRFCSGACKQRPSHQQFLL
jgi:16S rRNA (cytidine1402-2'-O)-methyltransferase